MTEDLQKRIDKAFQISTFIMKYELVMSRFRRVARYQSNITEINKKFVLEQLDLISQSVSSIEKLLKVNK